MSLKYAEYAAQQNVARDPSPSLVNIFESKAAEWAHAKIDLMDALAANEQAVARLAAAHEAEQSAWANLQDAAGRGAPPQLGQAPTRPYPPMPRPDLR